ncbi:hypothetical protein ACIHAR_30980 [Streptomyces sp. NPDC052016]|uniref:hypothetical protein n=1 Tax=Streptomyces sp. NPDC052016 TaxID=3365680 RepID=UPI0037D3254F
MTITDVPPAAATTPYGPGRLADAGDRLGTATGAPTGTATGPPAGVAEVCAGDATGRPASGTRPHAPARPPRGRRFPGCRNGTVPGLGLTHTVALGIPLHVVAPNSAKVTVGCAARRLAADTAIPYLSPYWNVPMLHQDIVPAIPERNSSCAPPRRSRNP